MKQVSSTNDAIASVTPGDNVFCQCQPKLSQSFSRYWCYVIPVFLAVATVNALTKSKTSIVCAKLLKFQKIIVDIKGKIALLFSYSNIATTVPVPPLRSMLYLKLLAFLHKQN